MNNYEYLNQKYPFTKDWPEDLQKMCVDSFDYSIKMTNGDIFVFCDAVIPINKDYIRIKSRPLGSKECSFQYEKERGLAVNVNHIVWIMDGA